MTSRHSLLRAAGSRVRLARDLGLRNVATVLAYRLSLRAGLFAREAPKPDGGDVFRDEHTVALPASESLRTRVIAAAEALYQGRASLFGGATYDVGAPPRWHRSPITGQSCDPSANWWSLPDFDPSIGDIKAVWEISRFQWAVVFAQAARLDPGGPHLSTLNVWVANWMRENPPYRGANWKCGQETSLRLLHLLLAARILDQDASPSAALLTFVETHLVRIAATRLYAMAQDNNHGTSEAAALYAAGAWLKRFVAGSRQRRAHRWAQMGQYWLEERVRTLVDADGGFSQYSTNYHRLFLMTMVQAETWRARIGDVRFSAPLFDRCRLATDWLAALTNAHSGETPNLGANDGADIFNTTLSEYHDYRPAVLAAAHCFGEKAGDATSDWTGLNPALTDLPSQRKCTRVFPEFGLALLNPRNDGSGAYAFLRFPRKRFRPSHADPLHFDLWTEDGRNLLRDGGTFSYADAQWGSFFSGIGAHNTVQFGDSEPMPRVSRFLFSGWIEGTFAQEPASSCRLCRWSGRYTDAQGITHTRTIEAADDSWRVIDDFDGPSAAPTIRWRLMQDDWQATTHGIKGRAMTLSVTGDVPAECVRLLNGFESLHYLEKSACPVVEARFPPGTRRIETLVVLGR